MTTTSRPADAALGRALALVRDLRARCSWDAAQTPDTLRPYPVEEALELDQAIRSGDPRETTDELGDLLLQLAFHIVIGEERGTQDAETVTQGLERKMWRRHPHLFAAGEQRESWEGLKRRERGAGGRTPPGLPGTPPPPPLAYRPPARPIREAGPAPQNP